MSIESLGQSVIYRLLHDPEFKHDFQKKPIDCLNNVGLTDETEQAKLLYYLSSPAAMGNDSLNETMKLADRFKASIKTSLNQIESGYRGAMWMYWFAFLTGILMIITAIVFAIIKKENLLSIVFGSLGTLDLLVFFVMKPPMELQNSRIGFARLEASFMNWFVDSVNLNSLYQQLGMSYGIGILDPQTGLPSSIPKTDLTSYMEKFMEISKQSMLHTESTLNMMGKIIREEALSNKKKKLANPEPS